MTRGSLNGETRLSKPQSLCTEYIGVQREPPELKHLSREKSISLVAASERERAQTGMRAFRGSDSHHGKIG